MVEERLRALGIVLTNVMEFGNLEGAKHAVEAGLGISVQARSVVQREVTAGLLHAVRLTGMDTRIQFFYARKKNAHRRMQRGNSWSCLREWALRAMRDESGPSILPDSIRFALAAEIGLYLALVLRIWSAPGASQRCLRSLPHGFPGRARQQCRLWPRPHGWCRRGG